MDQSTLNQLAAITMKLREIVYSVKMPQMILLDIDSTLLPTYGDQEGEAFNYHYQQHGYHPLLCYDGITGDLLKAELRDGTQYCSNGADDFIIPLLEEYSDRYPDVDLYLRGDSGFAAPDLYKACEKGGCKYAIRLKVNKTLIKLAEAETKSLASALSKNEDWIRYAITYGEFWYKAGSWDKARRVVFKIEKPYDQLTFMYTFIVTNMEMEPYKVIRFYCGRGKMENFIKEGKSGFDFASVGSATRLVNANRLQVHALAYNIFNWFRRLVLSAKMNKMRVDTIRLKLLKVAAKVVHSARYITFKLCSSCPYKNEFYETFDNIRNFAVQIE